MPGFRTGRRRDGSKYRYPLTPRRGGWRIGKDALGRKSPIVKLPSPRRRLSESLLGKILDLVLYQTPILRELSSALIVADSIFNNWSMIKELYECYKKDGLTGIVDSRVARNALAYTQTNVIWKVIGRVIPEKFRDSSLRILSTVVDKITDEEISYVKNYLQKNK